MCCCIQVDRDPFKTAELVLNTFAVRLDKLCVSTAFNIYILCVINVWNALTAAVIPLACLVQVLGTLNDDRLHVQTLLKESAVDSLKDILLSVVLIHVTCIKVSHFLSQISNVV